MTKEQICASLDAMLLNPKAKNFLNHLVRAYYPNNNAVMVTEKPNGSFKCAISTDGLITTQELLSKVEKDETKTIFSNFISSMQINLGEISDEHIALVNKIGVTGKETTTYMSYETYQEFRSWVKNKSSNGDKHINWLLASLKPKTNNKPKQNMSKPNSVSKPKSAKATYTLGDTSDALLKLKASLEAKK